MSQKWIRSKQWDDQHIPRALWPLKLLLRAFSSIPLAVSLLACVALYGTLASVPIGLIALAPTYLIYGVTLVMAIALVAVLPARLATRALSRTGASPAVRFIVGFAAVILLSIAAAYLWGRFLWPRMHYNPVTHSGFRLFGDFIDSTRSITVRRLPVLEMSELEFYAWWPLKVILFAFMLNMVTATIRRIEFNFHNLGVLTVHTGIVTIALGSIYYSALKQEGDMLLLAGAPDARGNPMAGPVETGFFDNTDVALWVSAGGPGGDWQQRPLRGLPRYNDYNLSAIEAGAGVPADDPSNRRRLEIVVPAPDQPGARPQADAGLRIRVVGYGSYVELERRWIRGDGGSAADGRGAEPLRRVELLRHEASASTRPPSISFRPASPNARVVEMGGLLGVEYARAMNPQRWRDLGEKLPLGTQHAIVVEVPGSDPGAAPFRAVYPIMPGAEIRVGETGYSLQVKDIAAQLLFPIITPGYENARSSIAVVRVTPPGDAEGGKPFDRWLYHRFPEIAQDMLNELNERGMPRRRGADPGIRITYLDCSISQVYFDEGDSAGDANDPPIRALLRPAGGEARIIDNLRTGGLLQIAPQASLRLAERWPNAVPVEVPLPVPESRREKDSIGNHHKAAVAVEITESPGAKGQGASRVLWLPFTQYLHIAPDLARTVDLSDGRRLTLAFGRVRRHLPDFGMQLVDFQMFPYPGSDTPRDYKSDLLVLRSGQSDLTHELRNTSLNDPLLVRVPFRKRPEVPAVAGFVGWLVSFVAPMQYKFSQAGWDAEGWRETQAAADRAELPRARARFTILGVGNNPGIYIIATGAILMSLGIPWAFYVKPLLVRAKKKRLQARLAAEAAAEGDPARAPRVPAVPVGAQV